MAGLSSEQKRKLLELMASNFKNYSLVVGGRKHVGALTDSLEQNRTLIESYGAEFGRILDGQTDWLEDLLQLQEDLFALIERGCPPLDIIDLMLACTSGRSPAFADSLGSVGLNDPTLHALKIACHWVAENITALNTPPIPGPLTFLSRILPELAEEDHARLMNDIQKLPELLHVFGDLLNYYPPDKTLIAKVDPWLRECELGFFYMLLDHFKFGYPTLSCMLKAMRHVRYRISPKATYLHRFRRVRVARKKRSASDEPDVRDPFSESALQRRLYRFSKKNGTWYIRMQLILWRYLSDEFSDQRAGGATLFSLLPTLMKPMR
jgi:hypothetical protein